MALSVVILVLNLDNLVFCSYCCNDGPLGLQINVLILETNKFKAESVPTFFKGKYKSLLSPVTIKLATCAPISVLQWA